MREDRLMRAIDSLLAAERAALLTGDYAGLAALAPRKESLFGAIPANVSDPGGLRRIAAEVGRNQVLLAAAIDGIKDAAAHVSEIRQARRGFLAYGREGQREVVAGSGPTLERKV
jgi:hypothetical protein